MIKLAYWLITIVFSFVILAANFQMLGPLSDPINEIWNLYGILSDTGAFASGSFATYVAASVFIQGAVLYPIKRLFNADHVWWTMYFILALDFWALFSYVLIEFAVGIEEPGAKALLFGGTTFFALVLIFLSHIGDTIRDWGRTIALTISAVIFIFVMRLAFYSG